MPNAEPAQGYLVVRRTSVRRTPKSDKWINYLPGSVVRSAPEHAPVVEWVASGHWKPIEEGEK